MPKLLPVECRRVPWLVQPDRSATGQGNRRAGAPASLLKVRAVYILLFQRSRECLEIVTHQVQDSAKQRLACMLLGEDVLGRMKRSLGRGHPKDQPAFADVDRWKS